MTRTHVTALAAGFTLLALPVLAQFAEGLATWDEDGDGSVDQTEFADNFTRIEIFSDWDMDGDGMLSERELTIALYEGYDIDESGRIEAPEFNRMVEDFGQDGILEL